ncbi:MAG: phosphatidylserine decarboxylase [Proteobacteria bacterium]|nr:phosphatidylserine decarboxylase [Pseudomonadota bacterium]
MEHLFATYFALQASHIMGRVAGAHLPSPVLKPLISAYALGMGISINEAEEPDGGFKCFSDFFGRRLRPGVRPVCEDNEAVISPCDGEIVAMGEIDSKDKPSFSIKGSCYDLDSLLGADMGTIYRSGGYLVTYLHPRNYHRVHVPMDSVLFRSRHIPGARYPLNGWLEDRVEEVYGKNERLVFHFALPSGGEFAIVMVAAFGVGKIETLYQPGSSQRPEVSQERDFDPPATVNRGDEVGAFLLGSTVVMVWSDGALNLDKELVHGATAVMGRRIGRIGHSTD